MRLKLIGTWSQMIDFIVVTCLTPMVITWHHWQLFCLLIQWATIATVQKDSSHSGDRSSELTFSTLMTYLEDFFIISTTLYHFGNTAYCAKPIDCGDSHATCLEIFIGQIVKLLTSSTVIKLSIQTTIVFLSTHVMGSDVQMQLSK